MSAQNFLSLRDVDVRLNDLNVLVGPNGSGKSNFLRIFRFIGEMARTDLGPTIDTFGGYKQLRFRGSLAGRYPFVTIKLEGMMTRFASTRALDEYSLKFRTVETGSKDIHRLIDRKETLLIKRKQGRGRRISLEGSNLLIERIGSRDRTSNVKVQKGSSGLAILRRLGDEYEAPQVEQIADIFENLRLFDIDVRAAREAADRRGRNQLRSDAANISAFLEWLAEKHPSNFEALCDDVRFVLPSFQSFAFVELGGSDRAVRVDICEKHLDGATPLGAASFGTIRSIALFAMLHDPNPPKLTCLEEIDHGLHPHALDRLVERLREASASTQIIVATHSPALVNRLDAAELIVFERDPDSGATRIPEITDTELNEMQEASGYRLGELWFSGLIGGGL